MTFSRLLSRPPHNFTNYQFQILRVKYFVQIRNSFNCLTWNVRWAAHQQRFCGLVLISNVPFSSIFRSLRLLSSSTSYRLILLSWSSFLSSFGHTSLEKIFYELFVFIFLRHFDRYLTRKWFLMRFYQPNYVGW